MIDWLVSVNHFRRLVHVTPVWKMSSMITATCTAIPADRKLSACSRRKPFHCHDSICRCNYHWGKKWKGGEVPTTYVRALYPPLKSQQGENMILTSRWETEPRLTSVCFFSFLFTSKCSPCLDLKKIRSCFTVVVFFCFFFPRGNFQR